MLPLQSRWGHIGFFYLVNHEKKERKKNAARVGKNYFGTCNYMNNKIRQFLIQDSDLRLTSLAALANLVDEKESHILRTDNSVLKFLIKTIERALADRRHRAFGWSADELAKG